MDIETTTESSDCDAVAGIYEQRIRRFGDRERALALVADRLSHVSRVIISLAGVCVVLSQSNWPASEAWLAAAGLLFPGWVWLVLYRGRALRDYRRMRGLGRGNEHSLACLQRRWDDIPHAEIEVPDDQANLAEDLDLFGHASLMHLVCMANTPAGIASLRDRLLRPSAPAEIVERQQSVAELAPLLDLRQDLNVRGRMLVASPVGLEQFLDWAEGKTWLFPRKWLTWTYRILSPLPTLLFLSVLFGVLPHGPAVTALFSILAINIIFSVAFLGRCHDVFRRVSSRQNEAQQYRDLFEVISRLPGASGGLTKLRDSVEGASLELDRLSRIMTLAGLQHWLLIYFPVQFWCLWDFHVLTFLEKWQARSGRRLRGWIEALGELEALSSLAALAHDNPEWIFPVVDPELPKKLEAESIGHPLLPDTMRVANDVTVGPDGSVLLVTGSNMSGKSTLLRSVGTNVVLAQAGAPVCATSFRMPPVALATSMRVTDSLEQGVSLFMAQLMRLKDIVEMSNQTAGQTEKTLLYLFDDILLGTNVAERRIAVVRILTHMIHRSAIGAIASHDLELATTPALEGVCRPVHFRESLHLGSGQFHMTFDYRMRPGVATTTNALELLRVVGLQLDASS